MSKISKELMAADEAVEAVSMDELENTTKEVSKMGKVSKKLMEEDKTAEAISMEDLEAEAKQPKVSPELMREDEATPAVSMDELEAEASDAKIGGIKYQNIIDDLHKLNMTDEEIKNLPSEAVAELNAYGAMSEAAKYMFSKEGEAAINKRDMALVNFLATHKDPFKELYEAATKK